MRKAPSRRPVSQGRRASPTRSWSLSTIRA
jgi:hypothetical protein